MISHRSALGTLSAPPHDKAATSRQEGGAGTTGEKEEIEGEGIQGDLMVHTRSSPTGPAEQEEGGSLWNKSQYPDLMKGERLDGHNLTGRDQ
jgi:hypothetical protein